MDGLMSWEVGVVKVMKRLSEEGQIVNMLCLHM